MIFFIKFIMLGIPVTIIYFLVLIHFSTFVRVNSVINELMEASFIANLEKIQYLMSLDPLILGPNIPIVDVHSKDSEHGRTALLICGSDPQSDIILVDKTCAKIAKLLKKGGANLSHVDNYGWNAIALGSIRGHLKFCQYLISHGVEFDLPDKKDKTPVMKVLGHGFLELFKLFFDNGASLVRKDQDGLTALHYSVRLALNNISYIPFFENVCMYLYAKSFKIDDAIDKNNRTVLMYAAINNNYEVSKILINYGSNPRLSDKFGILVKSMPTDQKIINMLTDKIISITEEEHQKWIEKDFNIDEL